MLPGMNPKQMAKVMKQMGIQSEDVDAEEVIIKTADKNIIVSNPSVTRIKMKGQETFQVMGEVSEQTAEPEPQYRRCSLAKRDVPSHRSAVQPLHLHPMMNFAGQVAVLSCPRLCLRHYGQEKSSAYR